MAADEDRDRLRWRRRHFRFRDVVELAVELEVPAGREAFDDLDALVHSLTALRERNTHQLVVLRPRAGADAEPQPVVEQRRQRPGLLGHQRRWPDRQLEHEEVELQGRGDRAQRAGHHEGLDERLAVQELAVAVRGVRVLRVGLERIGNAVRDRHRVIARRLGGFGQRDVVRRVGHCLGKGEAHAAILERVLMRRFKDHAPRERRGHERGVEGHVHAAAIASSVAGGLLAGRIFTEIWQRISPSDRGAAGSEGSRPLRQRGDCGRRASRACVRPRPRRRQSRRCARLQGRHPREPGVVAIDFCVGAVNSGDSRPGCRSRRREQASWRRCAPG